MAEPAPGTAEYEIPRGRIALWLEPDQVAFIVEQWRTLDSSTTPSDVLEKWGELAFRASAALHKNNHR